ncbi:MAG: hypothetical protein VX095_07810 [Pseudomonadota bacterium]|nr:hypothetical protein [Pseudomonadota bacterium]
MATITIDDLEYSVEDLSDSAKAQLASLQAVDQKIIDAQQNLAILQTARNTYASALREHLPDRSSEDTESSD